MNHKHKPYFVIMATSLVLFLFSVAMVLFVYPLPSHAFSGGDADDPIESSAEETSAVQSSRTDIATQEDLPTVEMSQVSEKVVTVKKNIQGIPVLETVLDDQTPKPVILLLHGYTGSKENLEQMAQKLAEQRYLVLRFDAHGHGEREGEMPLSVLEISAQSSQDVDTILASYAQDPNANVSQIGMLGFSMGGFAAYHYWANGEATPQALVTVVASPHWEEMLQSEVIYQQRPYVGGSLQEIEAEKSRINQWIQEHNPREQLSHADGIPILIIGQKDDPLVPVEGMQSLYDELREKSSEQTVLMLEDTGRHSVTEKNLVASYEFLLDAMALDQSGG